MRIVSFIFLFILTTLLPLPLTVLLICAYALLWEGYELLCIAVCLDAFFGAGSLLPYFTIGTTLLLVISVWIRPRLLLYNQEK